MTLHPLDLPALRGSPDYATLDTALRGLIQPCASFTAPPPDVLPGATITWLTRLVASGLDYLSPEQSEALRTLASQVLSLQCGRSAAPSMTRSFTVPTTSGGTIDLSIHEPTLTADSLGLKTWSTSFLLSRTLSTIFAHEDDLSDEEGRQVLELGSGTGLVGIAASFILVPRARVTMTDYLSDITRNLQRNVDDNNVTNGRVAWLDWTRATESSIYTERFSLVVASDFMYDVTHPKLVVDMFNHFAATPGGRVLAAYPLRPSNVDFIEDFKSRMEAAHWIVLQSGVERGYDDWGGDEGVTVHWQLYRRCDPTPA